MSDEDTDFVEFEADDGGYDALLLPTHDGVIAVLDMDALSEVLGGKILALQSYRGHLMALCEDRIWRHVGLPDKKATISPVKN